jgi:hypothetical protein
MIFIENSIEARACIGLRYSLKETDMAIQNYADEVMADCPVGYWRLGEPLGATQTIDATGNQNDGACQGPITFGQPGFHGGDMAALFTGEPVNNQTGRVVVLNSRSLNPRHITMEAKIRWDGPNDYDPSIHQRIIEKSSYREQAQYALKITPDGHVEVDIRTSSATSNPPEATSIGKVARGAETHIAATYKDNVVRIYLNGVLDSETPMPGGDGTISQKPPTDANLIESGVGIGNQTERDRPFKGLIDEVAIYAKELSADRILAHYQAQFGAQWQYQYAVKIVCGTSTGKVVAPGVYFTAVNVHNPTYTTVGLRAKLAVALPGLTPGPVSEFYDAKLGPDEALEIDCPEIFNQKIFRFATPKRYKFLKGFVVIESKAELDVVAVYTAAGRTKQVESLHTERVPGRRVKTGRRETCVDFEPPLQAWAQYGEPVGNASGDVIFTTNGIMVSVHDFNLSGGGSTFNLARIELASALFGNGQTMRLNNINMEFDFSSLGFIPSEVTFEFLDLGGFENLSVNGSTIFAGELSSVPSPLSGVNVSISATPVSGGQKGVVTLSGAIQKLRIGGQEFWIDNVCARQ